MSIFGWNIHLRWKLFLDVYVVFYGVRLVVVVIGCVGWWKENYLTLGQAFGSKVGQNQSPGSISDSLRKQVESIRATSKTFFIYRASIKSILWNRSLHQILIECAFLADLQTPSLFQYQSYALASVALGCVC